MGKIQRFQQAPVRSSVIASNISQAGQVGNAIASAARDIGRALEIKEKVAADDYVTNAAIDMQLEQDNAFEDWKKSNKENPVNATEKLNEVMQPIYNSYIEKAPNEIGKQRMQELTKRQLLRYTKTGKRWENQTLIDNTVQTTKKANESIALNAYNQGTEEAIEMGMVQFTGATQSLKNVADQDLYLRTQTAGRSKVAYEGIQGAIDKGNFEQADQLIGKYQETIGVDNVQKLKAINERRREAKRKAAEKALANKFKKPWEYVSDMKEDIPILDVTRVAASPDTFNDFEKRYASVVELEGKHRMDLPLLRDDEANQFLSDFEKGSPDQQDQLMNRLSKSMSDDVMDRFADQIFKKQPEKAVAFSLYEDDPRTSRQILEGQNMIKQKTYIPPAKDIKLKIAESIEGSFPSGMKAQETMAGTSQAILALYARKAQEKGVAQDLIDDDILEEARNQIIGPSVVINDKQILTFRNKEGRFVDEDDFEDVLKNLTNKRIKKSGQSEMFQKDGSKVEFSEVVDDIQLVPSGNGIYQVLYPAGGGMEFFYDDNGQVYNINLKAIHEMYGVTPSFMERIFSNEPPKVKNDGN